MRRRPDVAGVAVVLSPGAAAGEVAVARALMAPRHPRVVGPTAAWRPRSERSGRRLTPRASILAFVVFVAAIFAVAPARAFLEQRSEQRRLTQQVGELQHDNEALQQRLDELNDPVHLERLARECLGMVRPGEIAFVPIQRGQAPKPPPCD